MKRIRFRQSMISRNQTDTIADTTSTTTGHQQDFINRSASSSSAKYPTSSQDNRESPYYSTPDVIITPSPPTLTEPILLLEGDHYHISDDGIARSLYQLENTSITISDNSNSNSNSNSNNKMSSTNDGLMIEEFYDLKRACKVFLIREKTNVRSKNNAHKPVIHLGRHQDSLLLQEISDGIVGAGTGSMTWDSSIAMSLYFASHPELMFGNVIELGSGVGYGGILNTIFRSYSSSAVPFHSMTLTDYSNEVLQYCKENVSRFFAAAASSSIQVTKLDWHDFLRGTGKSLDHAEKYNTVIACECAYRYPDIVALISTMKGLVKRKKTSKVHIFGPINRGQMLRLISELRQDESFHVREEYIDMARYRLEAPSPIDSDTFNDGLQSHHRVDPLQDVMSSSYRDQACKFYSRYDSKFLHVTCSLRFDTPKAKVSLSDID